MTIKLSSCKSGNLHLIGVPTKWKQDIIKNTNQALRKAFEVLNYKKNIEIVVFSAPLIVLFRKLVLQVRPCLKFPVLSHI